MQYYYTNPEMNHFACNQDKLKSASYEALNIKLVNTGGMKLNYQLLLP